MPRRPAAVTTLAVLNITVGAVGVVAVLMMVLVALIKASAPPNNPVVGAVFPDALPVEKLYQYVDAEAPGHRVIGLLSHGLSLIGYTMLLVSGIGLLHVRRWAWVLALVYVVWNVLHTIFFVCYQFGVVLPVMDAFLEKHQNDAGFAVFFIRPEVFFYRFSTAMMTVAGGYPIVVLCLLFLPPVTGAFRAEEADLPPVGWGEERDRERQRYEDDRRRYEEERRRHDDDDEPPRRRWGDEDDEYRRRAPRGWD
jgi:hypothetical protein